MHKPWSREAYEDNKDVREQRDMQGPQSRETYKDNKYNREQRDMQGPYSQERHQVTEKCRNITNSDIQGTEKGNSIKQRQKQVQCSYLQRQGM